MVIRPVPRRAAAVLGALLAGLLLALTGCTTGRAEQGSSAGPPHSTAAATSRGAAPSRVPAWASGMPDVTGAALPAQARDTLRLIDAGGPFPYPQDGTVFGNRERRLPPHPRGYYHEYTVRTPGSPDRGARRLITGRDHETYYTGDHYRTFEAVLR
ncbi:ribonuclease domain-containing protein [Streptomyces endophytica]|uniref:Guanine-specific ribonuclease N1 and T1 n=1 Tax=Streptomyces endophytica TaxID=2991496 RepID=A0ABY6PEM3_9ACTN|nr:ribonuclease domain-containing protein [Streptomyces endophytica]UZJ32323.1 guanine-specific ribonuclease N1 and T1 [Streptomyces endophytica]